MSRLRTEPWVVEAVTVVHRANGVHGAQRRLTVEAAYRDAARALIRERRECECEADDCGEVALWAEGFTCPAHKPELRLVARVARLMRRADEDELVKVARDAAAMGREDDAKRLMSMRHAQQHAADDAERHPAPGAECGGGPHVATLDEMRAGAARAAERFKAWPAWKRAVSEDEEDDGRGPGRSGR